MAFPCVLCFRQIVKHQERYLVEGRGKFNVVEELKSLPFNVTHTSKFICKGCLHNLKKRKGLVSQLRDVNSSIESVYVNEEGARSYSVKRLSVDSEEACGTTLKRNRTESTNEQIEDVPSGMCILTSSPLREAPPTEWLISPVATHRKTHRLETVNKAIPPLSSKKNVDVTVKVEWPSKDTERKLPKDLESLGKMLVRGTYKQIANAAWKIPLVKEQMKELMLKEIEREATQLCSKKDPCCLRATDKNSMLSLTMEKVHDEIKTRAPLFHSCLSAASINRRSRACSGSNTNFAAVAMAAAVCLKNRSRYLIAVQLLVTIFLYHSNWMVSCQINTIYSTCMKNIFDGQ